ncbi:MAG: helix-turn-helix domain-containing protein, partial [Synergistaceae bacterium]|nr:helix-turn-helix domain-containing protein [Synergistaceae bacterium]
MEDTLGATSASSAPSIASRDVLIDKRRHWEARVEMNILRIPELTAYEKLVYIVLCGHADRSGGAFPSIAVLAQFSSCSKRQVFRALIMLEKCGLVGRIPRVVPGKGQICNLYEIHDFEDYVPLSEAVDMPDEARPDEQFPSESVTPPCDCQLPHLVTDTHPPVTDSHPTPCLSVMPPVTDSHPTPCLSVMPPVTDRHTPHDCQSHVTAPYNSSKYNNTSFGGGEPPSAVPRIPPPFGRREAGASAEKEMEDKSKPKPANLEIPYRMKQPAEYFLLKTKRTDITESEVEALRKLDKIHTAARVNREIDATAKDFAQRGKELESLSLDYIFAKLRHQQTLPAPGSTDKR